MEEEWEEDKPISTSNKERDKFSWDEIDVYI